MCNWTPPCASSLVPSVLHLSHGFQCSPTLNRQPYKGRLPLDKLVEKIVKHDSWPKACLGGAVGIAAVRAAWLWWSASPGSRPVLARSLCQVSSVCFEIKFSGRHRGFNSVLFNLWLLANTGFRDAQYLSLLEPLITDGLLLYAWPIINGSVHTHR